MTSKRGIGATAMVTGWLLMSCSPAASTNEYGGAGGEEASDGSLGGTGGTGGDTDTDSGTDAPKGPGGYAGIGGSNTGGGNTGGGNTGGSNTGGGNTGGSNTGGSNTGGSNTGGSNTGGGNTGGGTSGICNGTPSSCDDIGPDQDAQYYGCCDGDSVFWCDDQTGEWALHSVDCKSEGKSCGYDTTFESMYCVDGAGGTGGAGGSTVAGHACSLTMSNGTGSEPSGILPVCCAPTASEKAFIDEVFVLLNQHRQANGLAHLTYDDELEATIQGHCLHMSIHSFFDHAAPEAAVSTPWERASQCGTSANAENIAMGQSSPGEVMQGWKDSPGHNENMLDGSLHRVGVGYANGYWGQIFGM